MTKAKSKMAPQKIDNDFESNKDSVKANPKDAIERARNNLAKAKLLDEEKKRPCLDI
jgi:ribosomal protein S17E